MIGVAVHHVVLHLHDVREAKFAEGAQMDDVSEGHVVILGPKRAQQDGSQQRVVQLAEHGDAADDQRTGHEVQLGQGEDPMVRGIVCGGAE